MKFWPPYKRRRIFADAAAGLYNPSALHQEGAAAKKKLGIARAKIAGAIGAHADEIVFTSGGTEANNFTIFGALRPLLRAGRGSSVGGVHAVTTVLEHPSVLEPLRALVKEGLILTELGVDEEGRVNEKNLKESITDATVFVSIQLVNSEIGTIQDIRTAVKVLRHARKARTTDLPLLLHTDASQAPLWLKLNVEKLGVDTMTLDAQKVFAPNGTGALYVRRGVVLEPIILGGGQENSLRSGTESVALAEEFATALLRAQKNADSVAEKISEVRDFLFDEIKKLIPDAILNGPSSGYTRVASNLNVSIPGLDGQMAVIAMDALGVALSTRSACSVEDEAFSYILTAIGADRARAQSALRITLMPGTSKRDAINIARALARVVDLYRR